MAHDRVRGPSWPSSEPVLILARAVALSGEWKLRHNFYGTWLAAPLQRPGSRSANGLQRRGSALVASRTRRRSILHAESGEREMPSRDRCECKISGGGIRGSTCIFSGMRGSTRTVAEESSARTLRGVGPSYRRSAERCMRGKRHCPCRAAAGLLQAGLESVASVGSSFARAWRRSRLSDGSRADSSPSAIDPKLVRQPRSGCAWSEAASHRRIRW
jgi:hypothetical protein